MKKGFKQVVLAFILMVPLTLLFSQTKVTADIPNRDPNDPVYVYVEKMAQLHEGTGTVQQYIDYYPYPPCGLENNIQGKVVLQFIVERSGVVSNIEVMRSPDLCLSGAAIAYLKQWPL